MEKVLLTIVLAPLLASVLAGIDEYTRLLKVNAPALRGYALKLANLGWQKALASDPGFLLGLNTHEGQMTCEPVARDQKLAYVDAKTLL